MATLQIDDSTVGTACSLLCIAYNASNKTLQGYALRRILKPGGCFFMGRNFA